jgi:hypothetical protein
MQLPQLRAQGLEFWAQVGKLKSGAAIHVLERRGNRVRR